MTGMSSQVEGVNKLSLTLQYFGVGKQNNRILLLSLYLMAIFSLMENFTKYYACSSAGN